MRTFYEFIYFANRVRFFREISLISEIRIKKVRANRFIVR